MREDVGVTGVPTETRADHKSESACSVACPLVPLTVSGVGMAGGTASAVGIVRRFCEQPQDDATAISAAQRLIIALVIPDACHHPV
jgi:hypothetical protein